MPPLLDLTATQARVLGALLEKEITTPDAYPLTLNALVGACNQTSNRDPVVHYDPTGVETAVLALKAKGLSRVVHPGSGERATKYRHIADEALDLGSADRALLCVLLLRPAQTTAELKSRTERLHPFASAAEVEAALDRLARHEPPLVVRVERQPGQKEGRWLQLLEAMSHERATHVSAPSSPAGGSTGRLDDLEQRVAALEAQVVLLEGLLDQLG
jgi:uncharacterized protein YceH (UPF0502 family)